MIKVFEVYRADVGIVSLHLHLYDIKLTNISVDDMTCTMEVEGASCYVENFLFDLRQADVLLWVKGDTPDDD